MIDSPFGTVAAIDEHHLRVGDRMWFGQFHSHDYEGDYSWKRRQFVVLFENKWEVSVVWGYATYSDNHDLPWYDKARPFNETPKLVEAAILHADREGLQGNGDPYAYINTEQLNSILEMVSLLPTEAHIEWTGEWPSTSTT